MVVIDGVGLHTGADVRVRLSARHGAVRLRSAGFQADVHQLTVADTSRSTTVQGCGGSLRVATVEHAFAALGGLGIHGKILIDVEGPELPLLDGGSLAWCTAFSSLGVPTSPPRLRITRPATLSVGASRYELSPGLGIDVEVRVDFDDARVDAVARWQGDAEDFVTRVAPARTFALARDLEELAHRGLSRHVAPQSVVVLAPDTVHWSGRPFSRSEPACHKLLDLVGDCYIYGGPPLGRLRATRPGHRANTHALAQAFAEGVLKLA